MSLARRFLFAVAGLAVATAHAADDCASPNGAWSCYGVMEMRWKANGESGFARLSRFDNGELLAEVSGADGRKRMLQVASSGMVLYSGLSDEDAASGRSPFMFFDYAFALPGMAMQSAFPEGPKTVPAERVLKEVTVDGKRYRLSIARPSRGGILYRLEPQDEGGLDASGMWNEAVPRPLPGSYSLRGWTHGGTCEPSTLLEARSPACKTRQP